MNGAPKFPTSHPKGPTQKVCTELGFPLLRNTLCSFALLRFKSLLVRGVSSEPRAPPGAVAPVPCVRAGTEHTITPQNASASISKHLRPCSLQIAKGDPRASQGNQDQNSQWKGEEPAEHAWERAPRFTAGRGTPPSYLTGLSFLLPQTKVHPANSLSRGLEQDNAAVPRG